MFKILKPIKTILLIIVFMFLAVVASVSFGNNESSKIKLEENYFWQMSKNTISFFLLGADSFSKLELDNKFVTGLILKSLIYYKGKNDSENAIVNLIKVLELEPKNKYIHNNLGFIYHELKNYEVSMNYYRTAIELDPNFLGAIKNYSISKWKQKIIDEAKIYLQKSLDIDPYYFLSTTTLGVIEYEFDNDDKAKQLFNQILEVDPYYTFANRYLGDLFLYQEYYDEALKCYLKVAEYDIFNEETYISLGKCYYHLKMYELAVNNFQKALDINPNLDEVITFYDNARSDLLTNNYK